MSLPVTPEHFRSSSEAGREILARGDSEERRGGGKLYERVRQHLRSWFCCANTDAVALTLEQRGGGVAGRGGSRVASLESTLY